MPLIVLELNCNSLNNIVDRGFHCSGCARAICSRRHYKTTIICHGCQTSLPGGVDEPFADDTNRPHGRWTCKVALDRERLYSRTGILAHISTCGNVREYLANLEMEKSRPSYVRKEPKKRRYGMLHR